MNRRITVALLVATTGGAVLATQVAASAAPEACGTLKIGKAVYAYSHMGPTTCALAKKWIPTLAKQRLTGPVGSYARMTGKLPPIMFCKGLPDAHGYAAAGSCLRGIPGGLAGFSWQKSP